MSTSEADDLIRQRQNKLRTFAELGYELYPRRFDFTHTLPQILKAYSPRTAKRDSRIWRVVARGCKSTSAWMRSASGTSSYLSCLTWAM